MPIQKDDSNEPTAMRPPDELPPPPGDDDPPPRGVRIFSVSPIAGALAGGITVTLTGAGFQPEAEVFFGANQATDVVVGGTTSATCTLPAAAEVGSVNVSLFNPDGTGATRAGGFTYVVTGTGARAEVLGVTPLSVIEDTESEVTLRGRNLVEAHTNGMLALRGPGRVRITSELLASGRDESTGIEELTFTVRVVAAPALEQHERIAIQVLASARPGSQQDGIPESSRKMFTVLPRAVPVPIAFSDRLEPGKPNLVVVAGRNLEGCTLSVGEGATLHVQRGDEQTLVGLVSVSDGFAPKDFASDASLSEGAPDGGPKAARATQLSIHKEGFGEVARFEVSLARVGDSFEAGAAETAAMSGEDAAAAPSDGEPGAGDIGLTLKPMPGQQIFGPTAEDSAIFRLGGSALADFGFDFGPFDIRVFSRTFVFSLFNEVRVIPFFDNGVGDALSETPVLAQVGKLFRLRGMGLLVALRVELIVTIEVVIIIGFRFNIWPYGLFNEFYDDYPFGIGSIVITFRLIVLVDINFNVSFMVALIRPGGQLHVLFYFHLSIHIDFTISTDGRTLHFDPDFDMDVDYTRIGPRANDLRPCSGRFQLADDNGLTEFTNAHGDHHSFYFVHEPGECCLPWDFDLRLVRFRPGSGQREVVQDTFRADFCLTAARSPVQLEIVIVSDRTPEGYPPPLVLDVTETAAVRALARQRDEAGHPIPTAQLKDVRDLGYQVEFYIEPSPDVLDDEALRQGTAIAQATGNNTIHARLFKADVVIRDPDTGEVLPDALWPPGILGFDILNFLARGLPPATRDGRLPVEVNAPAVGQISVDVVIARRDSNGKLVKASELVRNEPFEPQQQYVLAAKVTLGPGVQPSQKLTFTVSAQMAAAPLSGLGFTRGRDSANRPDRFFSGEVVAGNVTGTLDIDANTNLAEYQEVKAPATQQNQHPPFSIKPNNVEGPAGASTLTAFVPPGFNVANRPTKLTLSVSVTASNATARVVRSPFDVTVSNEETFEEYLRVFQEVQEEILDHSALKTFASTFYTGLKGQGVKLADINTYLAAQGAKLWGDAVNEVQANATSPDDRPLYWTRLRCIAALRAYFKSNIPGGLTQSVVNQFEFPSRGLEADGSIGFGATPPVGRKAVVTGFDPFQLPSQPNQSNPSGMIALTLSGKPLEQVVPPVTVRTAVFPVRYKDFDERLVEKALKNLGSLHLLVTCSMNDADYYDVERFACKARLQAVDNDNKRPTATVPGAEEFYQSTLPYERVIKKDQSTRRLAGPNRSDTPFVTDQSYKVAGVATSRLRAGRTKANEPPVDPGKFRPEPLDDRGVHEDAAWKKQPDVPTGPSLEGSGYSFLSNEIFYRAARERTALTSFVATGHLHLPLIQAGAQWSRVGLISGVKKALKLFAENVFVFVVAAPVDFPLTAVNRTSPPAALTATNNTSEAIQVASAEADAPFSAFLPGGSPVTVNPGSDITLAVTFAPTAVGIYEGELRLMDAAGAVVLAVTLTSEAVPAPPAPVVSSFSPTYGRPGTVVTIRGENFEGASDVRIGGGSVPFTVVDAGRITATVTEDALTGPIEVETQGGTGASSATFRVIIRPPREELSAQLAARREELGLSSRLAAQQLGVTSRTYTRWERGQDIPRPRYRPAITSFLGHDPAGESETFGERIRAARERDGLSAPQLAERLGVSSSTVRAWEADRVSRPTPRVERIFEDYVKEE